MYVKTIYALQLNSCFKEVNTVLNSIENHLENILIFLITEIQMLTQNILTQK